MDSRPGFVALVLGVATWSQLVLVPMIAGHPDVFTVTSGIASLGVLGAALALRRHTAVAVGIALAAYPFALGLFAFVLGRSPVPRFDAASQVVAALTSAAYGAAVVLWSRTATADFPVTVTPLEDASQTPMPVAPAPPLRRVSQWAIVSVALFCGVIAPAVLANQGLVAVDETLARGRHALVAAVGLMMAVGLVLGGGSMLVRAAPPRERNPGRAVGYIAWAVLAFAMHRVLSDTR